jgi:hypothetical protein
MTTLAVANPPFGYLDSKGVSLFGLPAERSAKRALPGSTDDVLKNIASILDEMLSQVVEQRTAPDFAAAVQEVFPRYVHLVVAFARVASAMVSRQTMIRLSAESFAELESDFREHGEAFFGENLRERALFTVWTLRKTSDLLEELGKSNASVSPSQLEKDHEFLSGFFRHALMARFHVDILVVSMRKKRPLYPDVLASVDNGLRSVVNAYAWVKQAVDLRFPQDDDSHMPSRDWSDEEQALLDDSMRDLSRQRID